jgi:hypothetical protein
MLAAMSLGRFVSSDRIAEVTDLPALSADDGVGTERVLHLEVRPYAGVLLLGRLPARFGHVARVKGKYRCQPLCSWRSAEGATMRPD